MTQTVSSSDSLLTTQEAAQVVKLSRTTLERLRTTGAGPLYFKAGPGKRARVLYRHADLMQWLEKFRFQSTSEYDAP